MRLKTGGPVSVHTLHCTHVRSHRTTKKSSGSYPFKLFETEISFLSVNEKRDGHPVEKKNHDKVVGLLDMTSPSNKLKYERWTGFNMKL